MKSTQFLKAAGGIACVVFALNVNAQTATTCDRCFHVDRYKGR